MLRSIWDELEDMNRRIDETFGVFPTLPVRRFLLPTDVFAKGGDLVIHLDLPGIDPEKDVKITIHEGELVVTGERHFPIPKTIEATAIKATYKDGVLEIVLKGAVLVAEASKQQAKAIPVEVKQPELAAKA